MSLEASPWTTEDGWTQFA